MFIIIMWRRYARGADVKAIIAEAQHEIIINILFLILIY